MPGETLDPQQQACVDAAGRHTLIHAIPGSGKTRTLVAKVRHLVAQGVDPASIVVVTFTNKAAGEIRQRLDMSAVKCGTFHALALHFLQAHKYDLFADEFALVTNQRAPQVFFNKYLRQNCLNVQQHGAAMAKAYATYRTSHDPPIHAVASIPASVVTKCFRAYREEKRRRHEVDYDDLLHYWHDWLSGVDSESLGISHIFVDEAQDCNNIQFDIVRSHALRGATVVAVGDPDQSIYGFRGSNVKHIQTFGQTLPDAQVLSLEYNYRSTPEICFAAKCIIDFNGNRPQKQMKAISGSCDRPPCLYPFETTGAEHRFVADVCTKAVRDGVECAILCRTNREVEQIERVLQRRALTYCLLKGMSLMDKLHVKQFLNMLTFLFTKDPPQQCAVELLSMHRQVPKTQANMLVRDMMDDTVQDSLVLVFLTMEGLPAALQTLQAALKPMQRALQDMAEGKEYAYTSFGAQVSAVALHHLIFTARLTMEQNADLELVNEMRDGYTTFDEFLSAIHLGTLQVEQQLNSLVKLGTIHQAKGLEFECVVVPGCVNGNIPSALSKSKDEVEEERRLLYVAATRAKEQLCFTYSVFADEHAEKARTLSCFLLPLVTHALVVKGDKQLLPPTADPSCTTVQELLSDFYRMFGRHNLLVDLCGAKPWKDVHVDLTPCPLFLCNNTTNSLIQAGPTSCLLMKRIVQECVLHADMQWTDAVRKACQYVYGQHHAEYRTKSKLLLGEVSDRQVEKNAWPRFMEELQNFVDRLLAGQPEMVWVHKQVAHEGSGVEGTVDLLLDHSLFCFVFDLNITDSALLHLHVLARLVPHVTTLVIVNLFTGSVKRQAVERLAVDGLPLMMQMHPLAQLLCPTPLLPPGVQPGGVDRV